MNAEIVVSGSELLLGDSIDTNSALMARLLRDIGLNLYYKTTVGDNRRRMASVLTIALERSDVVLTSGGLGPTVDDVTREAVADALGRPLVFHPQLLEQITARFARFGRPMTENNRRQAYAPEGAILVPNPVGTAPAFIVEDQRGTVISLPGVPRELEYLMQHEVVPYLERRMGEHAVIVAKVLHTCAVGESRVDSLIADLMAGTNPTVGLLAHAGQVDVRITAKATDRSQAETLIAPVAAEVRKRLGRAVYGEDSDTLEDVIGRLLVQQGHTVAIIDTAGDGLAGQALLAGQYAGLLRGHSTYAGLTEAVGALQPKVDLPPGLSEKAAAAAAAFVRRQSGADLGLAIWGDVLSNTEPGQANPPFYLALDDGRQVYSRRFQFGGDTEMRRRWLSVRALDLLRRYLIGALADNPGGIDEK